jgi:hypothetical protein
VKSNPESEWERAAKQKPLEVLAGYIFREISQFADSSETFLSGTVRDEVAEISHGGVFARSDWKVSVDSASPIILVEARYC